MSSPEETNTGPVIRDLRRIDPATGRVRDPSRGTGQPGAGQGGAGQAGSAPAGAGAAGAGAARPGGGAGPRGTGKPRPGKHAVSKPGGQPGAGTGAKPGGAAGATGPVGQEAGLTGMDSPAGPGGADRPGGELAGELAERTADLQRVTAEYANYRKRVERDRVAVREQALANVLAGLLPVLDDIGRAREHGELVGGFKSVAESLEAAVAKLGLDSFGEAGEPFDPKVHEALLHSYASDVTEPTCVQILQPGYRVGDRILRPARVAVAEPGDDAGPGDPDEPDGPAADQAAGASGDRARDATADDD
jgi:molecular chaperone GrpE